MFGAIFPLKQPDCVGLSDDDKIEVGIEFAPNCLDLGECLNAQIEAPLHLEMLFAQEFLQLIKNA